MAGPIEKIRHEVDYPVSDGEPTGETPYHFRNMAENLLALELHFEDDPTFFGAANMFLFYEEGNRNRHVSPDLMLARGMEPFREREHFLLWEENKAPDLILELTSASTRAVDTQFKLELYQDLGVREYILFDPEADYLNPQLQGYRLSLGYYDPIVAEEDYLFSETLQLELVIEEQFVRFRIPGERSPLLWHREERERRLEAERERREAIRGRLEAERQRHEANQQRHEADRQRHEAERKQQESDQQRLEAERRQQESERQRQAEQERREQLEQELEELRKRLKDAE